MSGIDFTDDKMHEECGVFGIYSHSDDVAPLPTVRTWKYARAWALWPMFLKAA